MARHVWPSRCPDHPAAVQQAFNFLPEKAFAEHKPPRRVVLVSLFVSLERKWFSHLTWGTLGIASTTFARQSPISRGIVLIHVLRDTQPL